MDNEYAVLLRSLLTDQNVLSLGVLIDGEPFVGMVPFSAAQDYRGLIIHASALARHSKGLSQGAAVAMLIHASDSPGQDPLQLPRVSLQGQAQLLQRGSAEFEECKRTYLNKFPQSEMTFSLADFQLYLLELHSGRFTAGFARTLNLNKDHFHELASF
ncbi:MAG: hypothetical protein C5B54_03535 [Acidobacteria bacterium]|nr:MAG: hypothetical protein C5B54_03535 [Acidobacteriota bacterium]